MHWLFWPVFAIALLAIGFLVATGVLCEAVMGFFDLRGALRYGRFVETAPGLRFFISETGSAGPTVIFESGIIASNLHWFALQQALGSTVRTFAYDRAGLGWSSMADAQRLPSIMAAELASLLERSGVRPPYVLVAHSYGGLVARRFAAMFSEDVAGLVLVDPMRTEEWQPSNASRDKLVKRGIRLMRYLAALANVGLIRGFGYLALRRPVIFTQILRTLCGRKGQLLIEQTTRELRKMPPDVQSRVIAQWSRPAFFRSAEQYFRSVVPSVLETEMCAPLAAVPVIILSPANRTSASTACLQQIGDRVEQRTVSGGGHWLHLDRPDVVLQAVHDLMELAHPTPSQPAVLDESRAVGV